jgi:tetratricopeptide (TPR) repeat protein
LKAAVQAQPQSFFLNFALGQRLAETGSVREGIDHLEKAVELFPTYAGRQSPYAILAILYRQEERTGDELRVRSSWWNQSPMFMENALRLAELLEMKGDRSEALSVLEEAMYVDPFSQDAHLKLGSLYMESGNPEKAVREFRALLGLDPTNKAEAHFQLANALYQSGSQVAAKREVLLALENAPGWEQAQRLLLELVRQ